MQVYQVDYGGFLWYDKYYGRKMDEDGLKRALHQYFRNGTQLNEDIIDDVISRLKLLSNAVEKSPSFRFYGTSLLIIHEGCTKNNNLSKDSNKRCPVDVRLIDFAHTICDYTSANGRSSSSPSVLTKSSSAEQLSSCNPISTNTRPAATATVNMKKPVLPEKVSNETTEAGDTGVADELKATGLEADGAANRQSGQETNHGIDTEKVIGNDTENHHPSPRRFANAAPGEQGVEGNNNVISTKDNNNGFNIAFSKTSTKSPIKQKHNQSQHHYYRQHHLETLREVDHQASASELTPPTLTTTTTTTAPSTTPITTPPTETISSSNNNTATSNNSTTTGKSISSTPTTPPSLGGRKISKTSMGPDKGLLFGLENLMRLLDDLKSETLITTC
jgi:hypothetical protein